MRSAEKKEIEAVRYFCIERAARWLSRAQGGPEKLYDIRQTLGSYVTLFGLIHLDSPLILYAHVVATSQR